MAVKWRDAVLASLRSFCARHGTRSVGRQSFIAEELPTLVAVTGTVGLTPDQTLSRNLQELRDEGLVQFLGNGNYLLLDAPLDVEAEDLPDEALDFAIKAGQLKLGRIETDVRPAVSRRRKGQERLRALTLDAYDRQCAVCDVADNGLLIASHILRWADAPEHRGELANVVCLCKFHDALFEAGYWSLTGDLRLIKQPRGRSHTVVVVLDSADRFRPPRSFPPAAAYLRVHRSRSGLGE
jgi:hypothetical protein